MITTGDLVGEMPGRGAPEMPNQMQEQQPMAPPEGMQQ